MDTIIFHLKSRHYNSLAALDRLLQSTFHLTPAGHTRVLRQWQDTFDWRLFHAGLLLETDRKKSPHYLRLRALQSDQPTLETTCPATPRFHWDLPANRLRDRLKKIIRERALMNIGTFEVRSKHYEIHDPVGKVTCRLTISGFYHPGGERRRSILAWLECRTLRGYENEASKITDTLFRQYHFTPVDQTTVMVLFGALGKQPADYSSKINIKLDGDMPSSDALASVLDLNLDMMESNETGIKNDVDIEFLHDFRVANRRSRSLVTQVKGVFSGPEIKRHKKNFSWLSKVTGTHRDLDVALHDFNNYEKKIPDYDSEDLEPLHELLTRNRTIEHQRLLEALESQRFEAFKHDWRKYLTSGQRSSSLSSRGMTPISDIASQSIWKNYKKLMQHGDVIKHHYTFNSIHRLRKDGKKLRYLMEAFRSLYPDNDVAKSIKQLKKLQNNLGDIVDMHTQRFMLENWKQALQDQAKIPAHTIKAIDHLEGLCSDEEQQAEKKFQKRFRKFSSTDNKDLFQELFR